jgi:hypothetical protein
MIDGINSRSKNKFLIKKVEKFNFNNKNSNRPGFSFVPVYFKRILNKKFLCNIKSMKQLKKYVC